ncbi:hypothetical protein HAX54_028067 [Datura stramonium]|uniref:Uncharacterized protein n=1 Tax=Datura stramonium TaxID=4076 RepID=A0ABS8S9A1_DATST|nr:hypothetical protein [Datura stramonium]
MSSCCSQSGTNGTTLSCAGELSPATVSGGGDHAVWRGEPNSNDNNNINSGNNNESSKVADEGYASADDAVPHHSGSGRERKRESGKRRLERSLGISSKALTPAQVAEIAMLRNTSSANKPQSPPSPYLYCRQKKGKISKNNPTKPSLAPTSLPTVETSKINAFQVTSYGSFVLPAQIEKPILGRRIKVTGPCGDIFIIVDIVLVTRSKPVITIIIYKALGISSDVKL